MGVKKKPAHGARATLSDIDRDRLCSAVEKLADAADRIAGTYEALGAMSSGLLDAVVRAGVLPFDVPAQPRRPRRVRA